MANEGFHSPRTTRVVFAPATPCRQPRRTTTPPPLHQRRSSGILPAILRDAPLSVQKALEDDSLCAHLMLAYGDSVCETPLCVAVRSGASPKTIEVLLKHGADPNQCGSAGKPPLMTVAMSRPIFEEDVTRDRADTWAAQLTSTPLPFTNSGENKLRAMTCPAYQDFNLFASEGGTEGILRLPPLPSNIQSVMEGPQGGYEKLPLPSIAENFSAIPWCAVGQVVKDEQRCRMTEERCCAVAEVLLNYRADVFYQDSDGHTAAFHASQNGRDELVSILSAWADRLG